MSFVYIRRRRRVCVFIFIMKKCQNTCQEFMISSHIFTTKYSSRPHNSCLDDMIFFFKYRKISSCTFLKKNFLHTFGENIFIVTLIGTRQNVFQSVYLSHFLVIQRLFSSFHQLFVRLYTFIIIIIKITTELLEYFAGGDVFVIHFSCIFYIKIKIYKMYNFFHVSSEKKISTTVVTNKIDTNTYLFSSFSSTEAHTHTHTFNIGCSVAIQMYFPIF